jgi:hypothetical protein
MERMENGTVPLMSGPAGIFFFQTFSITNFDFWLGKMARKIMKTQEIFWIWNE